ncbi:MAG: hypothetical protein A3E84_04700 [Gammaproteobacteria bacterium RIFCSPHIGHO2_12_FULL_42_13]|nr:MAG: hypothetical protein A3E84_04700 [Gammaproteobacteria bacterium RIFCSPHIGHO2_12_FULL_42_13]
MKRLISSIFIFCFYTQVFSYDKPTPLLIPLHTESISLDPTKAQDFSSLLVSRQINCQITRTENGNLVLDAAEKVRFITPTRLYVKLKNTITFTNGKKLDVDDVIASLNFLQKRRVVLTNALHWITRIKKIDASAFEIDLKKPYPQFLSVFSTPNYAIFPKSFIAAADQNSSLWKKPITCGAYILKSNTKQEVFLEPRYQGLPVKFIFTPKGELSANEANQYDLVMLHIKDPENISNHLTAVEIFNPFQFFYIPNTRITPWNDKKARCTLFSKLNPQSIIRAYGKTVKPATDLIPAGTLGYAPIDYAGDIKLPQEKNNFPKSQRFCFSYIPSSIEKSMRSKFLKMFTDIYKNATATPLREKISLANSFSETGCDGIVLALTSNYYDAYEYLLIFSEHAANVSGYYNHVLTQKIENSQNIVSRADRAKSYRHIIHFLEKECLIYPLFTMPNEEIYIKKDLVPNNIGKGSLDTYLLSQIERT